MLMRMPRLQTDDWTLQQGRERLWQVSGEFFAACDAEGRIYDVNPAAERLLGSTRGALLGMDVLALVHPKDLASARVLFESPAPSSPIEVRVRVEGDGHRRLALTAFAESGSVLLIGRDAGAVELAARDARREVERDLRAAYRATGFTPWRWDVVRDEFELPVFGDTAHAPVAGDRHTTLHGALSGVPEPDRSRVEEQMLALAEGEQDGVRLRYPARLRPDAEVVWLEARCAVVRDDRGDVVAIHGGTHDVTESELANQRLRQALSFNTATLDALDANVAVLDTDGQILSTNLAWRRYAEANGGPSTGDNYLAACDAYAAKGVAAGRVLGAGLRELIARSRERFEVEALPVATPHGERYFDVRCVLHSDGGPARVVVRRLEVTEKVTANRAARMTASLLDQVGAAVIATDLEGRITHWNKGAVTTYGWTVPEALGREIGELTVAPDVLCEGEEAMRALMENGSWEDEVAMVRRDGSRFIGSTQSAVYRDEAGQPSGLIGVSHDITGRKIYEENLRAARDYLKAVTDSMGDGVATLDEEGRLTYVNPKFQEMLGWDAEMLIGEPLQHLRPIDGAERCENDVLRRRDGAELSVAWVSTPLVDETGHRGSVLVLTDITERLKRERELEQRVADLSMLEEIRDALEEDRLVMHGQPIVDLDTGEISHHELLLRMVSREGELVMPGSFLPVAERHGTIIEIDRWVIERACSIAAGGRPVAFNLSAQSFECASLRQTLADALRVSGASPHNLMVELTETAVMHGGEEATAFVDAAREMGVRLALDDFGTGFGGFSYLKRMNIHCLKIDIEFVRDIAVNPASRRVTEAVVGLGAVVRPAHDRRGRRGRRDHRAAQEPRRRSGAGLRPGPARAALVDQAQTHAGRHGGGAVADAQLLVERLQVRANGRTTQVQFRRDVRSGQSTSGEVQDLLLTFGQIRPTRGLCANGCGEACLHLDGKARLAASDGDDGVTDAFERRALEHEPRGARSEGCVQGLGVVGAGEQQRWCLVTTSPQRSQHVEAGAIRHVLVEDDDIWRQGRRGCQCGGRVVGVADEFEISARGQRTREAVPEERVIVDDQDAKGHERPTQGYAGSSPCSSHVLTG